jgi:hypothetical protein
MATHDDAMLMMQVMRWAEEAGAMDASFRLMTETRGSGATSRDADDPDVLKVLMVGETMGTFVKQGVLDVGLVRDLWAVDLTWRIVGDAARAQREQIGEPRLWENFESLAAG